MSRYWYCDKNYQRECEYIFWHVLASFNNSVEKSSFLSSLKKTNITHVFEKGDRNY